MQEFRPIDCVEALQERMRIMRAAQREFSKFTQEQVDHIFFEAAMAANKARIPLAKMAVEETGMGVMEDKVIKNHYASEYIYHAYRNTKTVGVIEQDDAFGIKKIAEPIGLVAAVIPTTNPTSTAIFKALLCLKTRNAILISPHPPCQEMHRGSRAHRLRSGGQGGRTGRHHRLHRIPEPGADGRIDA